MVNTCSDMDGTCNNIVCDGEEEFEEWRDDKQDDINRKALIVKGDIYKKFVKILTLFFSFLICFVFLYPGIGIFEYAMIFSSWVILVIFMKILLGC